MAADVPAADEHRLDAALGGGPGPAGDVLERVMKVVLRVEEHGIEGGHLAVHPMRVRRHHADRLIEPLPVQLRRLAPVAGVCLKHDGRAVKDLAGLEIRKERPVHGDPDRQAAGFLGRGPIVFTTEVTAARLQGDADDLGPRLRVVGREVKAPTGRKVVERRPRHRHLARVLHVALGSGVAQLLAHVKRAADVQLLLRVATGPQQFRFRRLRLGAKPTKAAEHRIPDFGHFVLGPVRHVTAEVHRLGHELDPEHDVDAKTAALRAKWPLPLEAQAARGLPARGKPLVLAKDVIGFAAGQRQQQAEILSQPWLRNQIITAPAIDKAHDPTVLRLDLEAVQIVLDSHPGIGGPLPVR